MEAKLVLFPQLCLNMHTYTYRWLFFLALILFCNTHTYCIHTCTLLLRHVTGIIEDEDGLGALSLTQSCPAESLMANKLYAIKCGLNMLGTALGVAVMCWNGHKNSTLVLFIWLWTLKALVFIAIGQYVRINVKGGLFSSLHVHAIPSNLSCAFSFSRSWSLWVWVTLSVDFSSVTQWPPPCLAASFRRARGAKHK